MAAAQRWHATPADLARGRGEIAAKASAFPMETTRNRWLAGCAACSGTAVCSCRGVLDVSIFWGVVFFAVSFSGHHQVQSVVVCKASTPTFSKANLGGLSDSFKVGRLSNFCKVGITSTLHGVLRVVPWVEKLSPFQERGGDKQEFKIKIWKTGLVFLTYIHM